MNGSSKSQWVIGMVIHAIETDSVGEYLFKLNVSENPTYQ